MPARSAGDNDKSVCAFKLVNVIVYSFHSNISFSGIHSSAQAVEYRFGLFENFFQHEVIESAFLNFGKFQVELLNEWSDLFISEILKYEFVGFDYRELIVVHIHNFLGVFNDGRSI